MKKIYWSKNAGPRRTPERLYEEQSISARDNHSQCLFCGHLNPQSLNLAFHGGKDGVVETRFQAKTELQGFDGILHGGIIAALLDEAMTHCLFHRGIRAYTGDLRVRFVRPVACNASMEIKARILSSRPPFYLLKGEITVNENIVAWSEAKFMQRRRPWSFAKKTIGEQNP